MAEEIRTVFEIPEQNYPKFEEQLAKLSRRAKKAVGQEIPHLVFGYEMKKGGRGELVKYYQVMISAEVPKIGSWQFAARLDHSNDTGNIIRAVPNAGEIPEKYRTCDPSCDHCGIKRYRRDTFVLRCEETGNFMQVGSGCLTGFFGFDASFVARMAEYLGYALEIGRSSEYYVGGDMRWISMSDYLPHAAWAVRRFGWISGSAAYQNDKLEATRVTAFTNYYPPRDSRGNLLHAIEHVEDQDVAFAQEALDWARSLSGKSNLSDFESNLLVIAGSEVIEARSLGIATAIVGLYHKKKQREAGMEEMRKRLVDSQFVGQEKERLDLTAKVIGRSVFEGEFGYTYLYRFLNQEGNVFVWFSSSDKRLSEGQEVTLRGTVKKHQERNNIKETVLTRCKVA